MSKPASVSVLLYDDRVETLDTVKAILDPLDVEVQQAVTEEQALELMRDREFAVVVADVTRPTINGPAFVEATRRDATTAHVPLILITADIETQRRLSGGLLGPVDCLLHPVEPALLLSKVNLFMSLFQHRNELSLKNRQLQGEIELAIRLQRGFLPASLPTEEKLHFGRYHQTCAELGGDLHDVFGLGRERVGLYMADVSGHGISAALLSGLVKMSFESLKEHIDVAKLPVSELLDPGVMLTRTNAALHEGLPDEVFITMMYAIIDPRLRMMRLSTAGHPFPIHYRAAYADASYFRFASGPALGPFPNAYFPVVTAELQAHDKLVFFTDGIVEAMNPDGVEFGYDRLLAVVKAKGRLPAEQLTKAIEAELDKHRAGAPFSDDCSMVVVHVD